MLLAEKRVYVPLGLSSLRLGCCNLKPEAENRRGRYYRGLNN